MAAVVNLWPIYSSCVVHSSWADFGQLSLAVLLPFIIFAGCINELLKRAKPSRALNRGELLVVFLMGMVAATMQGEGLEGYFLGVITAPHYFASAENNWSEYILAHVPSWALVGDEGNAATQFYEGLRPGEAPAWGAWIPPLVWWLPFFAAFFVVSFCMAVILRKQWVENERLAYPLARVPMLLVEKSDAASWLPDVARSRCFRIGFSIPLAIIAWNMLNWFHPAVPQLPLIGEFTRFPRIRIGRGFPAIHGNIDFFVLGFAFFTKLDVLFSIWFFHLLSVIQVGIFRRVGFSIGGADPWCSWDAATGWQGFGGFMMFVLFGLYMARGHLRRVLRKAVWSSSDVDDSGELLSYRAAVIGLAGGLLYIFFWMRRSGMDAWPVAVFLFGTVILYIGIAKITAESGLVYLRGPITAQSFTWHVCGSAAMSPPSIAAMGLTYALFCDAKCWVMAPIANVVKIAGDGLPRRGKRRVFGWVSAASLVGLATAVFFAIYLSRRRGAYNFGVATFTWAGVGIWNDIARRMRTPLTTDWPRLGFLAIGAAVTALLAYLRYQFSWWPLHPIGFTISCSYPIRDAAFTIFLVWIIKTAIVRIGGMTLYRRAVPFFVGTMVGYVLGIGLGFLVDVVWFNGSGHPLHGF